MNSWCRAVCLYKSMENSKCDFDNFCKSFVCPSPLVAPFMPPTTICKVKVIIGKWTNEKIISKSRNCPMRFILWCDSFFREIFWRFFSLCNFWTNSMKGHLEVVIKKYTSHYFFLSTRVMLKGARLFIFPYISHIDKLIICVSVCLFDAILLCVRVWPMKV